VPAFSHEVPAFSHEVPAFSHEVPAFSHEVPALCVAQGVTLGRESTRARGTQPLLLARGASGVRAAMAFPAAPRRGIAKQAGLKPALVENAGRFEAA
jgi:hypothetical protein